MNKKILFLTIICVSMFMFSYGLFIGQYQIFPYELLNDFKDKIFYEKVLVSNLSSNKYILDVKPSDLIQINTEFDVMEKRNSIVNYIWSDVGFPHNVFPSKIDENIFDEKLSVLNNLKRIDKITIQMEYGVNSISYLMTPNIVNNKLVIYHAGHGEDFRQNIKTLEFFLEKGYSVLAFSMPLAGMNNQPTVYFSDFGPIKLINHNRFQFLESTEFSPIKFFVEPIAISLNYIDKNYNYDSYHFVGISGGGWTAILYSAIDDRISKSFSIAGSLPLYLRTPQSYGDYEQEHLALYSIANYLELYILGGYGSDRQLVQIFNNNDPCCFSGEVSELYYNSVQDTLEYLNQGSFDIFIDENSEHTISNVALKKIHQYIYS